MVLEEKPTPLKIRANVAFDSQRGLYDLTFGALGTNCRIQYTATSNDQAAGFAKGAVKWVADFETKYSRFRSESQISEINRNAGGDWTEIDAEVESIFAICDDLHFMTQGVLDPTMLPLMRLWDYRDNHDVLPSEKVVSETRELIGWSKFERKPGMVRLPLEGMALDLGGFGKEYAVDKVAAVAVGNGINDCLVDFGRDIHALGHPPRYPAWHVALENPENPGTFWGSLAAKDIGLATSGDYRRFFEYKGQRYGHILDPRSGRPVYNGILSTTVTANSCLEAGVLSTAVCVLGEEEGLKLVEGTFGAEGCIVMSSGIQQTSKFYERMVEN
ncbi:MAG: FAD:protein FMN transferase [Verrucomicrobiota bacterium]|nr:FAD:protein FMN transferase [Verrucomicrobiota bacterium]